MTFLDDFDGLDENSNERIRPEFKNLIARGNVTPAEVAELRCNSWEWEALVPALSDEAFVKRMQYALDNCFTTRDRPFVTYNAAVEGLYAPELIRRFQAQLQLKVGSLDTEQLVAACKNIGFDLTCGTCAEIFYTGGSSGHAHDPSCFTADRKSHAAVVLDVSASPRTPDGQINNCALANSDEEKNCQVCAGQCPDRSRFETP
jgi:hypothetical protein